MINIKKIPSNKIFKIKIKIYNKTFILYIKCIYYYSYSFKNKKVKK